MARALFPMDPLATEIDKLAQGGVARRAAPMAPSSPKASLGGLDAVAERHGVPVGLLHAFDEAAGGRGDVQPIEAFAAQIAERKAAGATGRALLEGLGDPDAIIARAREIEGERYGVEHPPLPDADAAESEPSRLRRAFEQGEATAAVQGQDFARDTAAALEEGVLGRLLSKARRALGAEGDDAPSPQARAQAIRDAPRNAAYHDAQSRLDALEKAGFEVADWRDIRGIGSLVQFVGENIATSLPQMAVSLAAGPTSPAVTIAMLGGEANAELKERTEVDEATRVAIASGAGAAMWAFETIGLGKVVGGLLPSEVAQRALRGELAETMVKNGVRRAAARVIEAGIAEGSTEAIQEGIVMAATAAAGGEYTRQEVIERLSTAFAAGGGAGAGIRGAGEAASAAGRAIRPTPTEGPAADDVEPAASPSPVEPAEAPGSLGGEPQEAAGGPTDPAAAAPTSGPLEAAAAAAPPPQEPAPEPKPAAPVNSIFPDMKPGKEVRLRSPDGVIYDAVFLREEEGQVVVRIGADALEIRSDEFEEARLAAKDADAAAKGSSADAPRPGQEPAPTRPAAAMPDEASEALASYLEADGVSRAEAERLALADYEERQALARGEAPLPPVVASATPPAPDLEIPPPPAPAVVSKDAAVLAEAAADADPNPSDRQKAAGNYRMGHVSIHGLDVTIENAKGSTRSGKAPDGTEWSVEMPADYGYFKRTRGKDGDHVDVYVGDKPESDAVFIVNQVDADSRKFDEHKVIMGVADGAEALAIYEAAFNDGRGLDRAGSISRTDIAGLKDWLANGDTTQPTKPINGGRANVGDGHDGEAGGQVSAPNGADDPVRGALGPGVAAGDAATGDRGGAPDGAGAGSRDAGGTVGDQRSPDLTDEATTDQEWWDGMQDTGKRKEMLGAAGIAKRLASLPWAEIAGPARAALGKARRVAEGKTAVPAQFDEVSFSDWAEQRDPDSHVFPKADKTTNVDTEIGDDFVAASEAARIRATWKEVARRLKQRQNNGDTIIWSLFDYTGSWSKPWREAGYDVRQYDIRAAQDSADYQYGDERYYDLLQFFPTSDINDAEAEGKSSLGVLAATPCTTFAGSGARWWAGRHDVEGNRALIEKVWGEWVPDGFRSALDVGLALVAATEAFVDLAKPTGFHVLENPVGRIGEKANIGDPLARFQPHNFGDPYTKRTQLWGDFDPNMPTANVAPTDGSKMHKKGSGDPSRSDTPEGFAYAFFIANAPGAREVLAEIEAERAPSAPAPAAKPNRPAPDTADRPMSDYSGKVIDGETGLRDDGADAPIKKQFLDDASRYSRAVAKRLKDAGFADPAPAAGRKKGGPAVVKNPAGRAVSGDVYMNVEDADGFGVYLSIGQGSIHGPHGLTVMYRGTGPAPSPKHSRTMGDNRFVPRGAFPKPSEMAELLATEARSYKDREQRRRVDTAGENMEPPASREGATEDGERQEATRGQVPVANPAGSAERPVGLPGPSGSPSKAPEATGSQRAGSGPAEKETPAGKDLSDVRAQLPSIISSLNEALAGHAAGNTFLAARRDLAEFMAGLSADQWKQMGTFWGEGFHPGGASDPEKVLARLKEVFGPKPTSEATASPPAKAYGGDNTLVSTDRAAELRERLKAKLKGQLNAGIDPEILAIGAELAVFHIEAGARRFTDLAKAIAADLGASPAKLRPYLRSWYNGARDMMEDNGISIEGMDDADAVRAALAEIDRKSSPAAAEDDKESADGVPSQDTRSDAGAEPAEVQRSEPGGEVERVREQRRPAGGDASGADDGRDGQAAERPSPRPRAPKRDRGNRDEPSDRGSRRPRARNHVIPDGGLIPKGGAKTRARASLAAIRTLKTIESEGRLATPEEQATLARYGGAGSLKSALAGSDGKVTKGWESIAAELRETVTSDELALISKTAQYAFYTSEPVLRRMWQAAERLGFKGGKVYEPGMGVGGFIGTIPRDLASRTIYSGLELDPITARIAKTLYPQSTIREGDFTREPLARDHYDLVIGNPPFADVPIRTDKAYPQKFLLHDYFFAKSLDAVRPGGLLAFVTSAGTLNKLDSAARDYLADRADLAGAIRLPSSAFSDFAGTDVTTDIIFLRKRMPGEVEADATWRGVAETTLPGPDGAPMAGNVNAWFASRPEMILGEPGFFDTLYKGRFAVRAKPGADLDADLAQAVATLPENVVTERSAETDAAEIDVDTDERKPGSFYLKGDTLYQFNGTVGAEVQARGKGVEGGLTRADIQRVKGLVKIKAALRGVYAADMAEDAAGSRKARKRLNADYDAFVAEHGPINKAVFRFQRPSVVELERAREQAREDARMRGDDWDEGSFDPTDLYRTGATTAAIARERKAERERLGKAYSEGTFDPDEIPDKVIEKRENVTAFMDDPESYRLRAIEHYDDKSHEAKKTAVFYESVVTRAPEPSISSPQDAMLHVLNLRGRVDLDEIASLAGVEIDAARVALGDLIFLDPTSGEWQTRAKYLSGNVRRKLTEALARAETDPSYQRNVAALEKAQPLPIPPTDISVNIGATWVPPSDYTAFADSLKIEAVIRYNRVGSFWSVRVARQDVNTQTKWGTSDRSFDELMSQMLNGRQIEVRRTERTADGSTRTWLDREATQAAQDKAAAIREAFAGWIFSDKDRTERLAGRYNELFNSEVAPSFDGDYLTTPGITSAWSWRPHQKRVIARILQAGSTYMAHAVGAGKTSAMIGAGMEAKRLGQVRKPMYVVPNHMLAQFTKEFYEQYPLAKIAVADERRFHTSRRKLFVADVGANDYDAVIITHSAFGFLPVSAAFSDRIVLEQIAEFEEAISSLRGDPDNRITIGRLENLKEKLEQRLSSKRKEGDQVFTFEEMGVDMLFVDEAHLFRKLDFATQMGNVKGVDPAGSLAAWDLYMKTRWINERTPGKGIVLASGTPVVNTMAELFTLSRFIQPDALTERGLESFDAWAQTFGETKSDLEQTPDGGYKTVTRFSKFVNAAQLSLIVRQTMDVVTSGHLAQYVTKPKVNRELVVVPTTPEMEGFQKALAARMKAIAERKGPPKKGDDIILSVINDGRLAAIDMRLIGGPASESKLETLIDRVTDVWLATKDQPLHNIGADGYSKEPAFRGPAAQMIFTTLGVNPTERSQGFSTVGHIRASLIRRGIPADEIAWFGDAKNHVQRQKLFNDVNEGKVRILIGSRNMFTGVNAQRRLAALHNLDPLWFPADDEQRNGRADRQGNMNPEITIYNYSAKGTYDTSMWQMMGRKARFIQEFFEGDPSLREMEDLGEASQYAQAQAMTTSDPRVLQLTEMRQERDTLKRRRDAASRERYSLEDKLRYAERAIASREPRVARISAIAGGIPDMSGDAFRAKVGGQEFESRKEFGEAMIDAIRALDRRGEAVHGEKVGEVGGFDLLVYVDPPRAGEAKAADLVARLTEHDEVAIGWSADPVGTAQRVAGIRDKVGVALTDLGFWLRAYQDDAKQAREGLAALKPFTDHARLDEVSTAVRELESTLAAETTAKEAAAEKAAAELSADAGGLRDVPDASRLSRFLEDQGGGVDLTMPEWLSNLRLPRTAHEWITEPGAMASALLTDAMGGGRNRGANLLALVPGRALFSELAKSMPDAAVYLRMKERMDAMRNEWHGRMDDASQRWLKLARAHPSENQALMDLMHRATISGIDPSRPLPTPKAMSRATEEMRRIEQERITAHAELRRVFVSLPEPMQGLFREIAGHYRDMAKAQEDAVVAHITAAQKVAARRAEAAYRAEMRRIEDDGLTDAERDEAEAKAKRRLAQAKVASGWAVKARIGMLRAQFESNRLSGPYFPLARFGNYYVTLRNDDGAVVSFSRFETKREQDRFVKEQSALGAYSVEHGALGDQAFDPRSMVDPAFVADVQDLLSGFASDPGLMDAIWQRWLETLPDASIRKNRIHRKGRAGYTADALRAFTSHVFHGAHQVARLTYGAEMGYHLDVVGEQAKAAPDPERATLVLDEMRRRHAFTMNPKGAPWTAAASSLAFLWYLSVTPAAAIINLSQTTVVGIPLLKAAFPGSDVGSVTKHLGRALRDFSRGSGGWDTWSAARAKTLTQDERDAMREAYARGTVDKTQAHDLASVAETGVEYNGVREKWMRRASFLFHHAERLNREVTFLAAYRMGRDGGLDHADAIEKAADATWKVHFDYQNTSRPRFMQQDIPKVLTIFRQFTVNMLWRLFRDAKQSLHGATPAERKEARTQLVGLTLSMMLHAGITGTWGYGLVTTLISAFLPGDDDDVDAWLQDALLLQGEGIGVAAWNWTMGAALKGVPGQVTRTDLSPRLGMPNLWFRAPYRDMEGRDLYQHYVGEFLGPLGSIAAMPFVAWDYIEKGDWWRAGESVAPKFVKDMMRAGRFATEGVNTTNGDPILDEVSVRQVITQALGFTPAEIAERYKSNSRMRDAESRLSGERRAILRSAGDHVRKGEAVPEPVMSRIMEWNREHPDYPITAKSLKASVKGRERAAARNQSGIALNPRLDREIRAAEPQSIYSD